MMLSKVQSSEMNPAATQGAPGSGCDLLISPKSFPAMMKPPPFSSCDETAGNCCLQLGSAFLASSMKTHLNFIQDSVSLVGVMSGVGSFVFKKRI